MAPPIDPYRTLGLAPGASPDEIRRAYRRLAKANHPDSAGEAALPRFLAIQQAYEMLVAARTGRRPAAGAARSTPTDPWSADPGRGRATRDPNGRRRSAGSGSGSRANGPSGGGAGTPGAAGGAGTAGASGAGTRTGGSSGRPRRPSGRTREPNKATLGSTSYDAAEDEPFEPEWSGGTWYGASSGTYWTLNPKEYADPRKHGPEYQRRARRRLDGLEPDPIEEGPSIAGEDLEGPESESAAGEPGRSRFDGRWTYPDEDPASRYGPRYGPRYEPRFERAPADDAWEAAAPPAADAERPSLAELADRLLTGRVGLLGRILVVFLGWVPIAAGIAWLAGELSGCGHFTARCVDQSGVGTMIPVIVVLVILAALPLLAAISAFGTLGALALAVPAAVILSAGGGSRQPEAASAVLNVTFLVGYVAGTAFAVGRRLGWRRVP
jgi:hypothetical protein